MGADVDPLHQEGKRSPLLLLPLHCSASQPRQRAGVQSPLHLHHSFHSESESAKRQGFVEARNGAMVCGGAVRRLQHEDLEQLVSEDLPERGGGKGCWEERMRRLCQHRKQPCLESVRAPSLRELKQRNLRVVARKNFVDCEAVAS